MGDIIKRRGRKERRGWKKGNKKTNWINVKSL